MVVLKVFLLPLDWVPFFSLLVSAFLRSLSLGRQLHAPLFAAKRMTPAQVEVWMAERSFAYRQFGFAAALAENVPLLGLGLSISNRVGAAMYAHDLEKRQQLFRTGQRAQLPASSTYSDKDPRKPSGPGPSKPVGAVSSFASEGRALPGDFSHDQSAHHPSIPRPIAADSSSSTAAPPSYDASQAQHVVQDSASGGGMQGLAPAHASQAEGGATKRKVPPPPVPPRK